MNKPDWDNADVCARMRAMVQQKGASHWSDALKLAVEVPLVWYRVQALASLVPTAPEDRVDELLKRATKDAARDDDAYRRVAVLSWIIEAALSRGRHTLAQQLLADAIAAAPAVTPTKSRATALELLLAQAVLMSEQEAKTVAEALLDAAAELSAEPQKKWQNWGRSYINRTAYILSTRHASLLQRLLTKRFGTDQAAAVISRNSSSKSK